MPIFSSLLQVKQSRQVRWSAPEKLPLGVWVLIVVMICFGGLLLVRLGDIQLRQGKDWRQLADQNSTFSVIVPAERGILLDRYGQPLVLNRKNYFTLTQPDTVWSSKVPIVRDEALTIMASSSGQAAFSPITFTLGRNYPLGSVLAHSLGYVSQVTREDLQKTPQLPLNELVGRTGLEALVQAQLQGKSGTTIFEVNALGKKLRLIDSTDTQPGETVATTLDPYLSAVAATAMGERRGAVIVFEVQTGAILSLVNLPSFDPNIFQPTLATSSAAAVATLTELNRQRQIQAYLQSQNQVMFNRAISGEYPPGSIFKLVTALAGLSENKITPETAVEDTGILKVGEYSYANWYYTQYGRTEGSIKLERAISRSNDIYFYKAAEALGPTALAAWARRFGLGSPVGIELWGESPGLVPDPAWKEHQTGDRWYLGNTYHFGIGQGDLLVTPLQIAQLVQAIAAQGRLCKLHLLAGTQIECRDLGLTEIQLNAVRGGMIGACSPGGTAFPFFPINQAILAQVSDENRQTQLNAGAVACKTGTAEFGATLNAAGFRPTHGWFVMFADLTSALKTQQPDVIESQSPIVLPETVVKNSWLDHTRWLELVAKQGFPGQIGIVVLVESQIETPFIEGSRDAGPVARAIYDWLVTGKQPSN